VLPQWQPRCCTSLRLQRVTHVRARRARRSGPYKCPPRSGQARQSARPRQAGCGPHVTESILQAAELGLTMVLDLGRYERCLVGRGCINMPSPAPLLHAEACSGQRPPQACAEVLTACKEKEKKTGCLLCTSLAVATHDCISAGQVSSFWNDALRATHCRLADCTRRPGHAGRARPPDRRAVCVEGAGAPPQWRKAVHARASPL